MNFSQLLFAKTTAELGSFSKAAAACNVTQPTLSNSISKLEQELNHKIFDRTTRAVSLTEFGAQLIPDILDILALQHQIRENANAYSQPQLSQIRIGFSPLINSHIFASLSEEYQKSHPAEKIILIEENLADLENKLQNKELDIILIPVTDKKFGNNEVKLYEEDLLLIDSNGEHTGQVNLNEIRDKTFVMVPDNCGLALITRSLLRTNAKKPTEYEGKALSYQALSDWASNGLGAAILPRSKIPANLKARQLVQSNTPVKIAYKAKWLPQNVKKLNDLLTHFSKSLANK